MLSHQVKLFIILRQTPDWKNITYSDFIKQSQEFCLTIGRPINQVKDTVDLWNDTFGTSFFEARQRMKEISMANFSSVKHSFLLDDPNLLDLKDDDNSIVLFIDDDDWINPSIIQHISRYMEKQDGFIWGSAVYGGISGEALELRELDDCCYTNNYAVTIKCLRKIGVERCYQHFFANETFKGINVRKIDKYLTITNKHPCSTLFLEDSLKNNFSSHSLIMAVEGYNKKMSTLKYNKMKRKKLGWANKQILQTKGFFSSLKTR